LFGEETGSEELLLGWRDEDTACGVLGASAAMDTDAGTAGDLADKRQEALEARGLRDLDAVDESRDLFVEILEGVANKLITVSSSSVELAADGFALRLGAI
jgi:hypothetical protein